MLIRIAAHAADSSAEIILAKARLLGLQARSISDGQGGIGVGIDGELPDGVWDVPGVTSVVRKHKPYMLATKEMRELRSIVQVGDVQIGGDEPVIIAGPCSVQSEEELIDIAREAKAAGANMIRGGAFKPRTSPYSFQGMGEDGLKCLAAAREITGLPVVTEVMEPDQVELVAEYADMLQIGTRNMANFNLLKRVGRSGRPVLLKRGFAATIEEWMMSAEYILSCGNPDVVLCERGIRSFDTSTRFTLDLNAVPLAKELTHLPIMVDPSHGTGKRSLVERMSLAGLAAGADGLILEVHPDPERSLSDAAQTITLETLERIIGRGRALHSLLAEEPVFESVTTILRA
jgi:3-deoxy-7-phosphoheptulonate synthase